MEPLVHILLQLSAAAAGSLVAAAWEGLVLAGCVAVCLRLLPGITAAARSVVWSAVMLVVMALPFMRLSGPGASIASGSLELRLDERVSVALICLWAGFSFFRAVELIRSVIHLRRLAKSARAVSLKPAIIELLGGNRPVSLCVSDIVDRPSVVGFLSPRILLPSSLLNRLSQPELEQIVLHEMEHLRRGDDWTNLLQKLSLVLFPLNPVLLWVERRLCLERELACDDQVLRTTQARKAYAACLANLAEHSLVRRGVSLALGAWERQSELVRRVHRILLQPRREMGRRQARVAVGLMLCGLAAGADVLARSPRLVSFGPAQIATVADAPSAKASALALTSFTGLKPHAQQGSAHMVLAKAVVRGVSSPSKPAVKRPIRRLRPNAMAQVVRAQLISMQQNVPQPAGMVVLVTWRAEYASTQEASAPQASQFSYAAVPMRNGWLVVQL